MKLCTFGIAVPKLKDKVYVSHDQVLVASTPIDQYIQFQGNSYLTSSIDKRDVLRWAKKFHRVTNSPGTPHLKLFVNHHTPIQVSQSHDKLSYRAEQELRQALGNISHDELLKEIKRKK